MKNTKLFSLIVIITCACAVTGCSKNNGNDIVESSTEHYDTFVALDAPITETVAVSTTDILDTMSSNSTERYEALSDEEKAEVDANILGGPDISLNEKYDSVINVDTTEVNVYYIDNEALNKAINTKVAELSAESAEVLEQWHDYAFNTENCFVVFNNDRLYQFSVDTEGRVYSSLEDYNIYLEMNGGGREYEEE